KLLAFLVMFKAHQAARFFKERASNKNMSHPHIYPHLSNTPTIQLEGPITGLAPSLLGLGLSSERDEIFLSHL
ncbi:hypothetical protein ACQP3L_40495, partial [Escherichia coli]